MFIAEIIFAFLIGTILASILAYPLDRRGPGPLDGLLFFFLILFLAVWAGGVWLTPVGPPVWGVPWLGFLVVGILIALIVAAAVPPRQPPAEPTPEGVGAADAATLALGAFFYIALIALLVAIIARYVWLL